MVEPRFEELLDRMPAIAAAVNAFQSEAVQQQAFTALVRSFHGEDDQALGAQPQDDTSEEAEPPTAETGRVTATSGTAALVRTRTRKRKSPSLVRGLDLNPTGEQPFREFAKSKNPKGLSEKNTLSVYYLKQILNLGAVGVDHVLTCYSEASWPYPSDLNASLRKTASRTRYIDTGDMQNIHMTPKGLNLVQHDLPRPAGKK
jgi:hypothetical protein